MCPSGHPSKYRRDPPSLNFDVIREHVSKVKKEEIHEICNKIFFLNIFYFQFHSIDSFILSYALFSNSQIPSKK